MRFTSARYPLRAVLRGVMRVLPNREVHNRARARLYQVLPFLPLELLVHSGDVVYQVGTPKTQTLLRLLRSVGPRGHVVGVEAERQNFAALCTLRERHQKLASRLSLIHKAAFSQKGTLELRLSLARPGDHFLAGLNATVDNVERPDADFEAVEVVEADTLDNMAESHRLPPPDVLIITVNGAETDVLHGAERLLSAAPAGARALVQSDALGRDGQSNYPEIAAILQQYGFVVCKTRPSRSVSPLRGQRSGDAFAYRPHTLRVTSRGAHLSETGSPLH